MDLKKILIAPQSLSEIEDDHYPPQEEKVFHANKDKVLEEVNYFSKKYGVSCSKYGDFQYILPSQSRKFKLIGI